MRSGVSSSICFDLLSSEYSSSLSIPSEFTLNSAKAKNLTRSGLFSWMNRDNSTCLAALTNLSQGENAHDQKKKKA